MSDATTSLEQLNLSELLQILNNAGHGRLRLRRSVSKDRLIYLIRTGETPKDEEISMTSKTRSKLQGWIEGNWDGIGSQLPCTGPRRGQCTVYPCTEGRHLDCYLSAKKHML